MEIDVVVKCRENRTKSATKKTVIDDNKNRKTIITKKTVTAVAPKL